MCNVCYGTKEPRLDPPEPDLVRCLSCIRLEAPEGEAAPECTICEGTGFLPVEEALRYFRMTLREYVEG